MNNNVYCEDLLKHNDIDILSTEKLNRELEIFKGIVHQIEEQGMIVINLFEENFEVPTKDKFMVYLGLFEIFRDFDEKVNSRRYLKYNILEFIKNNPKI